MVSCVQLVVYFLRPCSTKKGRCQLPDCAVNAVQKEQRRWQRLPVSIPVFLKGLDGNGKDYLQFATALNIGAGGVLVASSRFIPLQSHVSIEIPTSPVPPVSALPASVRMLQATLIRVTPLQGYYLLGLQFISPVL